MNGNEERLIRVIWKYPPEQFPYLRVGQRITNKGVGPIRGWKGDRVRWVRTLEELREKEEMFLMVGYEEVERNGNGIYFREYYWLKSYDRFLQPDGIYKDRMPTEATTEFVTIPLDF